MSTEKGNGRLADLLRQIAAEGAEVKTAGKSGSALTADALSDVSATPEFDAWISWTKSF